MQILDTLARNLGQLREQRGLTLSGLSQRCGIAKSTLSGLESARGNPTIETLWAIANALDTPFGQLVSGTSLGPVQIGDGQVAVRFIERTDDESGSSIESYRMHLAAGHTKQSAAHPPGVREKVVVTSGPMLVGDLLAPRVLNSGEVHSFPADVPHVYGAMGKPAQAVVFVEYPASAAPPGADLFCALEWPVTAAAWEGVECMLTRVFIEVANGFGAMMLRFRGCRLQSAAALALLRDKLLSMDSASYRWPQSVLMGVDVEGPFMVVLPRYFAQAFTETNHPLARTALGCRALVLAREAEADLISESRFVEDDLVSEHKVLQALGGECALKSGQLILPKTLKLLDRQAVVSVEPSTEAGAFSSRIQVEHYDAFELLHPAYARQVVAMAQDVVDFTPARQTVDIGTGPGLPLLMLQELLPDLKALAVEPDPVAYACLRINVEGREGISLHQGGFLELDLSHGQSELITSVGSSHHFNTAFMLQKARMLLKLGGVLSVADEFLPSFRDVESRNAALVRHHSAYILHVAAAMECCDLPRMDDLDYSLYRAFQQYLGQAVFLAEQGQSLAAVRLCRDLFAQVRQASLDKRPAHAVGAYVRFFWLELQAMVAGFDYEVECKTHVRRFLELAAGTGLELLRHRRVYATCGDQAHDGGTHVMTFRRRGA